MAIVLHREKHDTRDLSPPAEERAVAQLLWRSDSSSLEVELVAIEGGGHGMPQAAWRRPKLAHGAGRDRH